MATPKIALVTGGSRGIGKSIALHLAQKGHHVLLTYLSNQAEAAATVAEIEALGQQAVALPLAVGDVASFAGFFQNAQAAMQASFGTDHFDFLINNAGTGLQATIAETPEAEFDTLLNVQYKGVYFLTQRALPLLNDGGRVVNISSVVTRATFLGSAAYASAKGAVDVFTRYLAQELGPRRITANVVSPGAIVTDFGGGGMRSDEMQAFAAGITALGRAGQPDDVGPVVAFLCSDEAGWINAQRIEVSGGQSL